MLLSNSITTSCETQSATSSSSSTLTSIKNSSAFIPSPHRFNANNANSLISRLASSYSNQNSSTSAAPTTSSTSTISLTTSSPLVAKYINQNATSSDSTESQSPLKTLNTVLNPEGYLSNKLNQTRAAREAFMRSGPSVSSNNTSTTSSAQNTSMNASTLSSNTTSPLSITNQSSSQPTPPLPPTTTIVQHHPKSNIENKASHLLSKLSLQSSNSSLASNQSANTTSNGDQSLLYQNVPQPSVREVQLQPIREQPANVQPQKCHIKPAEAPAPIKVRQLDGYVGFANLPNQVYRKSVKKGFDFNLMIIGETGLGKSTFINSLFLTELYNANEFPGTHQRKKKTVNVDATTVQLCEKGVNLRLTVVDTPGFGEGVDNTNCWQPIVDYIDLKCEEFLNAESRVHRKPIVDNRIHCCLYFIAPGHGLKQLDVDVMKKLHDRVNLIPVIAKADTMTIEEIRQFKRTLLNEINASKIQIYEFPDMDDDDVEASKTNAMLKSKLPFAIVGSNTTIEIEGKTFRGRQYPWGVVNIDDLNHCDFMALRTMLIRTHMQDLKDVTNNVHYENFRYKKLAHVAGDKKHLPNNKNPFQQLEDERRDADARLDKMKAEMEAVFEQKVKEKIARLKDSELNLEKQQESMKISLEKEEKELEQHRIFFLKEKQLWEEQNKEEEERLKQTLEKELEKKKKKIF